VLFVFHLDIYEYYFIDGLGKENPNCPFLLKKHMICSLTCVLHLFPLFFLIFTRLAYMQTVDNDLALKIYIKARATPKVVAAFAERREFDKILIYSKQVNFFISLVGSENYWC